MIRKILQILPYVVLVAFFYFVDRERRALEAEGLEPTAPGIVDEQIRTAVQALLRHAPEARPLGVVRVAPRSDHAAAPSADRIVIALERAPGVDLPAPELALDVSGAERLVFELAVIRLREPWFDAASPFFDRPLLVFPAVDLPDGRSLPVEEPTVSPPFFYRVPEPALRHYGPEIWVRLGECLRDPDLAALQGITIARHRSDPLELTSDGAWSIRGHASGTVEISPLDGP